MRDLLELYNYLIFSFVFCVANSNFIRELREFYGTIKYVCI